MEDEEKLIGRHLGQQSEYPERYDPGLLVAIPRALNREQLEIAPDHLPFSGYDVWTAWEVSALTQHGLPFAGVLRFVCPADSPNLVESKSVKLYLNSFNSERLGITESEAKEQLRTRLTDDISAAVGAPVQAQWIDPSQIPFPPRDRFNVLEELVPQLEVDRFTEDPESLEVEVKGVPRDLCVCTSLLRSRCRQTQQPDWGDLFVELQGPRIPTAASLLRYIVSFREENHFHEEIVEAAFVALQRACQPDQLKLTAHYTRRGGIDINPVRLWPREAGSAPLPDLQNFPRSPRQ